jgi:anti-sigma B factor antagonist
VADEPVPGLQSADTGQAGETLPPGTLGDIDVASDGSSILVRLTGEVDLSLSDELSSAYEACLGSAQPVRVDMTGLSFIDSTGIGFVARLAASEQAAGRRLTIVGASRRTSETLSLTGLDDLLDRQPAS